MTAAVTPSSRLIDDEHAASASLSDEVEPDPGRCVRRTGLPTRRLCRRAANPGSRSCRSLNFARLIVSISVLFGSRFDRDRLHTPGAWHLSQYCTIVHVFCQYQYGI